MAAGVLRVDIDPFLFDYSTVYCGGDYWAAKSKVVSDYQAEMIRFLFTWNAFETIVEAIRPTGWRKGKTKSVGGFLADRFEPRSIMHYDCAVASLRKLVNRRDNPFTLQDSQFELGDGYGTSGIGIKVVARIRNLIAHVAIQHPEPEGWGGQVVDGLSMVTLARQIVLHTIQMILIVNYSNSGAVVECCDREFDEYRHIEIETLLRTVHLQDVLELL